MFYTLMFSDPGFAKKSEIGIINSMIQLLIEKLKKSRGWDLTETEILLIQNYSLEFILQDEDIQSKVVDFFENHKLYLILVLYENFDN